MTLVFGFDAETSAVVDLQRRGADAYSADPETRCLMFAFKPIGFVERPQLWLEGEPPPERLCRHVANGGLLSGWNVLGFDRLIWNRKLVRQHGFPAMPDDNWRDSMHLAASANLPRSLDGAAKAVGVEFHADLKDSNRIRRITDAKRTPIPYAVREMLKPEWLAACNAAAAALAASEVVDDATLRQARELSRHPLFDLTLDLAWLADRCVQDVVMEEQVLLRLPPWPDVEPWIRMPAIDRRINDRGILIDRELVEGMAKAAATEVRRLNGELARLTNGQVDATTKVEEIKRWLLGRGVPVPLKAAKKTEEDESDDADEAEESPKEKGSPWRLRKNDVANLLSLDLPEDCRRVLHIRADAGKTSTAKLTAMGGAAGADARLRQMILLMGAQATGRFSSKIVQVHNLVRDAFGKDYENIAARAGLDPKKDKAAVRRLAAQSLRTAIEVGRTGDADLIRAMYEEERRDLRGRTRLEGVLPWISRMMRRTIAAPAGHLLLNGDFANIEARIPVWLAGQIETVEAFARGEDLYRKQASPVYGRPPESLSGEERQIGKVMRLFLGFAAGVGAFIPAAMNYGLDIPREDGLKYVQIFRDTNRELVAYWDNLLQAARWAVSYPGREFQVPPLGNVSWRMEGNCLLCRLPSGRSLRYWAPRLEQGTWPDGSPKQTPDLTVLVVKGRSVFRRTLWRGLAVENVVQAIAADMLCVALANLDRRGFPVTLHVHDSTAAEVREDDADRMLPIFKEAMLDMPAWTAGLPTAVDADYGARFG